MFNLGFSKYLFYFYYLLFRIYDIFDKIDNGIFRIWEK